VLDHSAEASHAFLRARLRGGARPQKTGRVWLVCDIPRHRERLAAEMELWGINALVLPEPPSETGDGTIADPESAAEWFSVLEILARSEHCAVLCGSDAFAAKAPSPAALRSSRTTLKPGTELDPTELAKSLADHGYERVPTVTARGQFAVRGGIIDLFAWQAAKPLRLEFFDTDLESIREFDLDSQASTTKLLEGGVVAGGTGDRCDHRRLPPDRRPAGFRSTRSPRR
jgi:transcription-repair coupling factor (superfamily II helicase)